MILMMSGSQIYVSHSVVESVMQVSSISLQMLEMCTGASVQQGEDHRQQKA